MTDTPSPPAGADEPDFAPTPWLEQHPLAHWLFDIATLRLLWGNAAALARYGHEAGAFVRLTRDDLLVPDDVPRAHAFMAALPQGLPQQPVWRERTRDGRVLAADWRGLTVRWQGRRARLIAVMDAGHREALARDEQRSRELLQVAGRMAHIGGWSVDLQAGVVTWSDELCALHEVPPGTRQPVAEALRFYPEHERPRVAEALDRCIASGEPIDFEAAFVGARGTRRWVRVVGEAVRAADGTVLGVQGAQQDITVAHEATRALAHSQAHLAALIAAIPDLWMVYSPEFRYLDVSEPAHPGLSAPWSEKLGRRIHETVEPELADELVRLAREAHRTGRPQAHHYRLRVSDGRQRWFEARYVAMSEGRTLALIRDVTETRELEQRFQDLAETAPIGIFIADDAGAVAYANPGWRGLMELEGDAALGLAWAGAVHPDEVPAVAAGWARYAADGGVFEAEFRLRATATQPERVVWAQARPMPRTPAGAAVHVGCLVDVTPARELQREREARAVAEEAGRRQSDFLSRVSHELRTPLNAILGFGELLRGELADQPRRADFLGHMVQAGRHMLALVDDLLALQRIEQGQLEPRFEPLRALALLQSVAQMLAPLAQGAAMRVQVEADAALALASDERALRQILLNLASNAIKYGRRGGGLWLQARVEPAAGGTACLFTVRDDGPGMDEAQLQRLFMPFERLGQDRGAVAGSGLGLVISRQLAQALGGTLGLSSRPGVGTTAELRLPQRR